MDSVKIGKYLASLRRQAGLTQEMLGEKLGVTNKTISRWENGNYMPDIEMFGALAREFGVSIEDLLAGEKTSDENLAAVEKSSAFSFEERKAYFKKKWRKEHRSLFVMLGAIQAAAFAIPFAIRAPWAVGFASLIGIAEYCYQNNKMMIYVENHLYDG